MISELSAAADALKEAEYTLVSVGNGMNLDSGLPNLIYYDIFFRDSQYGIPGQNWFVEDPARELGYFSHRSKIYKKSTPHEGYKFLASLKNCFLYTSCVEGINLHVLPL
jgi:NAD-dependent SIR2 family protein deacetylase